MQIELTRKHAWMGALIIAVASSIILALAQYSYVPDPGHGGTEIEVIAGGQEKTLQQAIDDETIGQLGNGSIITGVRFSNKTERLSAVKGNVFCEEGMGIVGVVYNPLAQAGNNIRDDRVDAIYCAPTEFVRSTTPPPPRRVITLDNDCVGIFIEALEGPDELGNRNVPPAEEPWRAQCPNDMVLVGIYDTNDNFEDFDGMKCCPLTIS